MHLLLWIILTGTIMGLVSFVGGLTYFLKEEKLKKFLHFFPALAAGTLMGGALFQLLPESLIVIPNIKHLFLSFALGFTFLLFIEQIMLWCTRHKSSQKKPLGYLILLADSVHNFIAGVGIGSAMIIDLRMGLAAWMAELIHELPQELCDFGILVESGWTKERALLVNFISACTFPLGGVLVYFLSSYLNVAILIPFAAGNFVYIAASGLIPEIKQHTNLGHALLNSLVFTLGLSILCLLN